MRQQAASLAFWRRALVALACALSLSLVTLAMGHQRGMVATHYVEAVAIAAATGQPCPVTGPATTVCPFAGLTATADAEALGLRGPATSAKATRLAVSNENSPASRGGGTPFRPPREA